MILMTAVKLNNSKNNNFDNNTNISIAMIIIITMIILSLLIKIRIIHHLALNNIHNIIITIKLIIAIK